MTTNNEKAPPNRARPVKCNDRVYAEGECIGILSTSGRIIEAIVETVREHVPEGTLVDWHWAAGRGIVKAVGDVAEARVQLQSVMRIDFRPFVDGGLG
jgi:hypothetical protein